MPYKPIPQGDIDKIVVRTKDGTNYLAEYDSIGNLVPVREISKDTPPSSSSGGGADEQQEYQDSDEVKKIADNPRKALSDMHSGTKVDVLKRLSEGDEKLGAAFKARVYGGHGSTGPDEDRPQAKPKIDLTITDSVFRSRLSSIMTDNKYDRRLKGRKRGRLDMTRLFKVKAKSEKVFTRKESRKNKNYNVVLVVDESGSMHGAKIKRAAEICTFLAKTVDGLNVDLAIVGFNHYVVVHKDFHEKINFDELQSEIVRRATDGGAGCNHDYDALHKGYSMLKGRTGDNIVIFMSDGAPASCSMTDLVGEWIKKYLNNDHPLKTEADEAYRDLAIAFRTGKIFEQLGSREQGIIRSNRMIKKRENKTRGGSAYYMYYGDFESPLEYHEKDQQVHLNALVRANEELATTVGIGINTTSWQVPDNFTVNKLSEMKPRLLEVLNKKIKRG